MEELVIETKGLTKRYGGGVVAVDSVDMTVRRGEVYGFLGPNGAGKTTTLRMLLGLIRPDMGRATVAGYEPGKPAGLARIGSLIEQAQLHRHRGRPGSGTRPTSARSGFRRRAESREP